MSPKKKGRPSKFNQELAEQICELIREGNFRVWVARKLELTTETIRVWARDKPEFSAALKEAEEDRQESLLQRIAEASTQTYGEGIKPPDWKAAAWILERMYPKQFALKNRVELQAETTIRTSDDQLRAEIAQLEADLARVESGPGDSRTD